MSCYENIEHCVRGAAESRKGCLHSMERCFGRFRFTHAMVCLRESKILFTRRTAMLGGLALPLAAQTNAPPSTTLKVGDKALDFTLPSTEGGTVHLADYLGKSTVVLAFFPAAFTGG
jgi:hypothetical protein